MGSLVVCVYNFSRPLAKVGRWKLFETSLGYIIKELHGIILSQKTKELLQAYLEGSRGSVLNN